MKREIEEMIAKQASYDAMFMAKLAVPVAAIGAVAKPLLSRIGGMATRAFGRGAGQAAARGAGGLMQNVHGVGTAAKTLGQVGWGAVPKGAQGVIKGVGSFLGPSVAMEGVSRMMTPSQPQQPGY